MSATGNRQSMITDINLPQRSSHTLSLSSTATRRLPTVASAITTLSPAPHRYQQPSGDFPLSLLPTNPCPPSPSCHLDPSLTPPHHQQPSRGFPRTLHLIFRYVLAASEPFLWSFTQSPLPGHFPCASSPPSMLKHQQTLPTHTATPRFQTTSVPPDNVCFFLALEASELTLSLQDASHPPSSVLNHQPSHTPLLMRQKMMKSEKCKNTSNQHQNHSA